jgi:RHS repeat-associated protein
VPCDPQFDAQWVGDPVDTLTGAVYDRKLEFRLVGPIEFSWFRHYDSSQSHRSFALGNGHTHEFERSLSYDAGEIVFHAPVGRQLRFPLPARPGEEVLLHGFVLRRITFLTFHLLQHATPTMEFEFADANHPAPLRRLFRGRDQILFAYDTRQRLQRIIDSAERTIDVSQDALGRIVSLTWQDGSSATPLAAYRYDDAGNLAAITYQSGHGYQFEYDADHRMVMRSGRKGFKFRFVYDALGRCVESVGDNRLYAVRLEYRVPRRLTRITRADGGVWDYAFDPSGALVQIRDPLGGLRRFFRDAARRVVQEVDANLNVTRVLYDASGAPVARIDPLGWRSEIPEDPNAPAPRDRRIAGDPFEYQYGGLADATRIALPNASELAAMQLPDIIKAIASVRSPVTPVAGSPHLVAPLGVEWWPKPEQGRVFNDFGKLVAQHDESGRSRHWSYDASGNLAAYRDFDGGCWTYEYGTWHLLLGATNPARDTVHFSYTPSAQVASFADELGARSEYRYDLNDHLVEVRRHGRVRDEYVRDAAGNLLEKRAADGRVLLRFERGKGNLPVQRTLASGDEHRFRYDPLGRYLLAATRHDSVELAYDSIGNCVSEKRNGMGVVHRCEGWNVRVESLLFDRFAVRYERSARELQITDPAGATHAVTLHGHGIVRRRFSNGTEEVAQYDVWRRCRFKSVNRSTKGRWTRRYHWSGESELELIEDSETGNVRHEYDESHRLSRRTTLEGVEDFRFDPAGNLMQQPGLEMVVLLPGNRIASSRDEQFAYNDRNHVERRETSRGSWRYEYDSRDLLVRIQTPSGDWSAQYDALGRRTRKTWNGSTTEFYWSGDQLLAEIAADGRVRIYVYADALALTPLLFVDYDSIESPCESGRRYCIVTDQLGTPCLVENERGETVWRARIEPYGRTHVHAGASIEFNLRFPGHYSDAEIALNYNRFRYYDPALGRYLQSDPWGISGGTNLYAYRSNPLAQVDVRGLGEEGDTPRKSPEDDAEGTTSKQSGKSANPLAHLSDEDLQNHCKTRADELTDQMTNPRDKEGVTIAVTVVQEKGDPETRRVIVTSSTNDGSLPPGCGPLHSNETVENPGPVLRSRNAPPDENGNVPQRVVVTEHESGGVTAESKPQKALYADDPQTGEKGTVPYEKRTASNPDGESSHHAEQRAQNAVGPNEEVAAMSPGGRPCCPGCQNALGDNLNKVPPDRRGI